MPKAPAFDLVRRGTPKEWARRTRPWSPAVGTSFFAPRGEGAPPLRPAPAGGLRRAGRRNPGRASATDSC
ncbi:hypothetical protein A33M_3767 [Rhodovulum sp. PH10]|nr:hypothetical protein A33M_3767 [Rhodovulum sp. PH10]